VPRQAEGKRLHLHRKGEEVGLLVMVGRCLLRPDFALHSNKYQEETTGVQKKIHILCGSAIYAGMLTPFPEMNWALLLRLP
jgi:hypothetical protein